MDAQARFNTDILRFFLVLSLVLFLFLAFIHNLEKNNLNI